MFDMKFVEKHISGIIMNDETARGAKADLTESFMQTLRQKGIVCGIKIETEEKQLLRKDGTFEYNGMNNLNRMCALYYSMGFRFAKWSVDIKVEDPNQNNIENATQSYAKFASIC